MQIKTDRFQEGVAIWCLPFSSHGWVKRGLPYIQAYFEEKMAIVSRGGAVYVNIVV